LHFFFLPGIPGDPGIPESPLRPVSPCGPNEPYKTKEYILKITDQLLSVSLLYFRGWQKHQSLDPHCSLLAKYVKQFTQTYLKFSNTFTPTYGGSSTSAKRKKSSDWDNGKGWKYCHFTCAN
jgi:hypothetical protein